MTTPAYLELRGPGGSIVLVASAAARTGMVNHEAIAAAKAGVEGLARSAAASYAAQNVWVSGQVIGVDGGLATLRGKARP